MTKLNNSITDIPGITVGHADNHQALTGCTVILCEKGAVGGVEQRGGAPGTRETDALRPMHLVQHVHAVVLSGGSAFGLDAAGGVMHYLSEKNIGVNTGVARVSIVAGAILFDLGLGDADVRPDAEMGYQACKNSSATPPVQGSVGAGIGATVGKILGMGQCMRSGIGTASMEIGGGVIVAAMIAVNPFGDVIDPTSQKIIAGARPLKKGPLKVGGDGRFVDTLKLMKARTGRAILSLAMRQNTVIGVVATNAKLTKEEANFVAGLAHDGLGAAIRPAHTMLDGDTLFCMATGQKRVDVNIVGAFAPVVVTEAILNAVRFAAANGPVPSILDINGEIA